MASRSPGRDGQGSAFAEEVAGLANRAHDVEHLLDHYVADFRFGDALPGLVQRRAESDRSWPHRRPRNAYLPWLLTLTTRVSRTPALAVR